MRLTVLWLRVCDFIAEHADFGLRLALSAVSIRRFRGIYSQALGPQRRAIDRVLQWVESSGIVSRVRAKTRSTSASETVRGRPLRGSSTSPFSRCSKNLDRHFPTVGLDTRNWEATAVLVCPSAHPRMIRARRANA